MLVSLLGASLGFDPKTIPNLQLWLKADAGVYNDAGSTLATNGQTVQQWNDFSGGGKNATQSIAGQRPTYRSSIDGMPAIQFTRASNTQLLAGGNGDFNSPQFTVFVVSQTTASVTAGQYFSILCKGSGAATPTEVWEILGGFNGINIFHAETASGASPSTAITMSPSRITELITMKRDGSDNITLYRSGVQESTVNDGFGSLNAGGSPLGIGSDGGSGSNLPWTGYLREVLYYAGSLTDQQRNSVEAYLRVKWNLTGSIILFTVFQPFPASNMSFLESLDAGTTFTTVPPGVSNPVFTFPSAGGSGTTLDTQAICGLFYNNKYWVTYEFDVQFSPPNTSHQSKFGIASATSLGGTWSWVTDVTIFNSPNTNSTVWQPMWFLDDDGSVHIIVGGCNSGNFDDATQLYIVDALNASLTSWSAPTQVTGSGLPVNITDHCGVLTPAQSPNGKYNIIFHDENLIKIGYMSSSSLKSGYTITEAPASDFFGIGSAYNPVMVKMSLNSWRLYASPTTDPFFYVDSADGWATWSAQQNIGEGSNHVGTGNFLSLAGSIVSMRQNGLV